MAESMREAAVRVSADLAESDPRTAVVLAVIGRSSFDAIGARETLGRRLIDVGIREAAQIGVAGGLALEGFTPIVHGYAPFLIERPFEQIKISLTHQAVGALLVSVGGSYDAASEGRTHHAPGDVALMGTLPSWEVHVPGHPNEVERALRDAHARGAAAYVRTSIDRNRRSYAKQAGEVVTLRNGSDGAPLVIVVGPLADAVLDATEGRDVRVVYMTRPVPFDRSALRALAASSDEVAVVEPYLEGTSVAGVAAALNDRKTRIHAIGVPRRELRRYGSPADHRRAYGLDVAGLRARLSTIGIVPDG